MVMQPIIFAMDANTARTENMRRLVAEAGGPAEWVRRYGGDRWTQPQVSQWISESSPKGIGGRLARDLERTLGLGVGALDQPSSQASQSARPDFEKIAGAVRILYDWLELMEEPRQGVYDSIMLDIAYGLVESSSEPVTDSNVIQFVKQFRQAVTGGQNGHRSMGRGGS